METTLLSFIFLASFAMGLLTRRLTKATKHEAFTLSFQHAAMMAVVYTGLLFVFNYFTGAFEKKVEQSNVHVEQVQQAPQLDSVKNFKKPERMKQEEQLTVVDTPLGFYTFSSYGAVLQEVTLHKLGGDKQDITVLQNAQAFATCFEDESPFVYSLQGREHADGVEKLTYTAPYKGGMITKQFTVHTDTYEVELQVECVDCQGEQVIRSFLPEPHMQPELAPEQDAAFVAQSGKGSAKLKQLNLKKEDLAAAQWLWPSVFVLTDKYFIVGLVQNANSVQHGYINAVSDAEGTNYELVLQSPQVQGKAWSYKAYIGPKVLDAVMAVDKRLEATMSYGMFSFIAKPLDYALNYVNEKVHSYGWALVILTVLLKLLLMPFTARGQRKMQDHAKVSKKMEYLKKKYQHDPEALKVAQAELIKKHGMPPVLSGCLPSLLFLPVMFALNGLLRNSLSLYNANFLWIPNLAAKDPYYILPLAIAWLYLFMPSVGGNSAREGLQKYVMAVFMGGIMTTFTAGVQLFSLVNFALVVIEQRIAKGLKRA